MKLQEKKSLNTIKGYVKKIDDFLPMDRKGLRSASFWFVITLIYISFVNFFVIKTSPEVIFFQYFVLVALFLKFRLNEFTLTWVPFLGFFLVYEFLRGIADDISPFREITLFWIHTLETKIFGTIPTKVLQDLFAGNKTIVDISLFFYSMFFYYSFLVAFLIWIKYPKFFQEYFKKFLAVSFVGLTFFFLIPTAPPWMVNESTDLGIIRFLYGETILKNFTIISFYQYFIYGNTVAALPSLHSAWPMFTSLFLVNKIKNKLKYVLIIIPLMIGFSVVLAAEHYLLDVVAGFSLAYFVQRRHSKNQISAK